MMEVISAHGMAAKALSGLEIDAPVVCKLAMVDGKAVAGGGLAWMGNRCWLWFFVEPDMPQGQGRKALRYAAAMLRQAEQLGETEVFTLRDGSYETSERLCALAGFEKTDEIMNGQEVWQWRH